MRRALLVLPVLLALCVPATAERIVIPLGAQGSGALAAGLPEAGRSEAEVEARYGPPATRHPPVGTPPIERWDYPDFSVYFENGRVVHSVLQHRPVAPTH